MPSFRYTLRQLQCFVAVAEAGSIVGASTVLRASDSAVADALSALEAGIGTPLVERHRARGVRLTSDGLAMLPAARQLLAQAEDLTSVLGDGDEVRGAVRVGILPALAPPILPRLIADLGERHPRLRLDFSVGDQGRLSDHLRLGDLDAVITCDIEFPPVFSRRVLYGTTACVVIAADHPLADRDELSLAELRDEPMVLLDGVASRLHTMELMSNAGVSPRVAYRTAEYELCRSMVARGLGYSVLLWRGLPDRTWDGGRIVSIPITPRPRTIDVHIAWKGDVLSPRVAAVVDRAAALHRRGIGEARHERVR